MKTVRKRATTGAPVTEEWNETEEADVIRGFRYVGQISVSGTNFAFDKTPHFAFSYRAPRSPARATDTRTTNAAIMKGKRESPERKEQTHPSFRGVARMPAPPLSDAKYPENEILNPTPR